MAEAHLTSLLLCFFFLAASSAASTVLRDAIQALSASGFSTMSAHLEPISQTLSISQSSPLTVFAPTNSAFDRVPHRDLLLYHLCPLKIPIRSIATLRYGTAIPTYFTGNSLIVTTNRQISLNNIVVSLVPIFDSGPIAIYSIRQFFNPLFKLPRTPFPHRLSLRELECRQPSYIARVNVNGYTVAADFLDLQLARYRDQTQLTVFAPSDSQINDYLMDFREYGSFFRRHVVPCKLKWRDLWRHVKTDIPLPTFLEGYTINVTRSSNRLALNGVPIERGDVYDARGVVVHGISKILELKHGGVLFGRLQDISDCAGSHARGHRNGSLTVTASNVCLDWREVDSVVFEGSILNDIKPPLLSEHYRPPKKAHFNCMARFADYHSASDAVKAIGDSFISAFLNMQLIETGIHTKLTVLAPLDENDDLHWHYYYFQYRQYVIPCKLTWSDLVRLEDGTTLPTLVKDDNKFTIVVVKSGDTLLMNGVPVIYPDLYTSDTLVIHGISSKIEDLRDKYLELVDHYASEED